MTTKVLFAELSKKIDKSLVKLLIKEYTEVKQYHFKREWEQVGIHTGKFCEACIASLYYIKTGKIIDLNKIEFGKVYTELLNMPKATAEDEIVTLIIPRATRALYTLRSKRSVAHIKDVDPTYFDSVYFLSSCDWIVSELIRLYHTSSPSDIKHIIDNLLKRQVPIIEEFGNDLIVLDNSLSAPEEILVILYQREASITDLKKYCNQRPSSTVYNAVKSLVRRKFVFLDEGGIYKITSLGIESVEKILKKKYNP